MQKSRTNRIFSYGRDWACLKSSTEDRVQNSVSIYTIRAIILFFIAFYPFFSHAEPPRSIPDSLYNAFTLNGQIPIRLYYFDGTYPSDRPLFYDFLQVEQLKKKAIARAENYYHETDTYLYNALDRYLPQGSDKKIGILGSTIPWYEAVILAYGGSPVTVEYNKIVTDHPGLRVMTVAEYEKDPEEFDALLSISSFEHDGLGRYGDPINPIGDLDAMKNAKRMLKKGGLLFLSVPVGKDILVWNAHRVYGSARLPLLMEGWTFIDSFGFKKSDFNREVEDHQPVFVLLNN